MLLFLRISFDINRLRPAESEISASAASYEYAAAEVTATTFVERT